MLHQDNIFDAEETLTIETPERVPLAFSLASIGNRFLAVAIDHAIQYTAVIAVIWIIAEIMRSGNETNESAGSIFSDLSVETPKWIIAILLIAVFALFSGYFIIFEWLWDGQTPGKTVKARVIREDGRPITLWEASARNLLRILIRSRNRHSALFCRPHSYFYEQPRPEVGRYFCRNGGHS